MKHVMWNFHVDYLKCTHRYNMILGCYILFGKNIDLCISYNTIKLIGGSYEGCTAPMKDVLEINFKYPSNWVKDEIFCNKEIW